MVPPGIATDVQAFLADQEDVTDADLEAEQDWF